MKSNDIPIFFGRYIPEDGLDPICLLKFDLDGWLLGWVFGIWEYEWK